MLARLFRCILFNLLHLVYSLLVAVNYVYRSFWTAKSYYRKENIVSNEEILMIVNNTQYLRKKLQHVLLLSDTRRNSLSDFAILVIWSLVAGIPYISFYDVTGDLTENEEKFFLEVERWKKGIPGFIKWSKMPALNGYTNGLQANTINVNIFSYKDGQPKIAQCIKKIARNEIPFVRSSDEFTAEELNNALSLEYPSIPDPEIVLYTGPVCYTFGLLPWQIRLSEFIQLSVDNNISIENYLGALYKYNKCDQRFGK